MRRTAFKLAWPHHQAQRQWASCCEVIHKVSYKPHTGNCAPRWFSRSPTPTFVWRPVTQSQNAGLKHKPRKRWTNGGQVRTGSGDGCPSWLRQAGSYSTSKVQRQGYVGPYIAPTCEIRSHRMLNAGASLCRQAASARSSTGNPRWPLGDGVLVPLSPESSLGGVDGRGGCVGTVEILVDLLIPLLVGRCFRDVDSGTSTMSGVPAD
ncbi:uncharacterized protein B0T23DRAFT_20156 [Neurospora hispaniola]|uniref:Uncharacterized protein n=1 Tax=Neurospora hispaniola TaxID=588809 RepID=A0AAJ0IGR5_9PEZI|nr:hypothetical protein B0T23DRAFT_20156 [Neurospora hispaniola]